MNKDSTADEVIDHLFNTGKIDYPTWRDAKECLRAYCTKEYRLTVTCPEGEHFSEGALADWAKRVTGGTAEAKMYLPA